MRRTATLLVAAVLTAACATDDTQSSATLPAPTPISDAESNAESIDGEVPASPLDETDLDETDPDATASATSTPTPATTTAAASSSAPAPNQFRVDLQPSGNRVIEGPGVLTSTTPVVLAMPDGQAPVWVLPDGNGGWLAELADGRTMSIDAAATRLAEVPGRAEPSTTPPVSASGALNNVAAAVVDDALADGRIVSDGERSFVLTGASDRYAHGVLGDALEPTAVVEVGSDGAERTVVSLEPPDVFETLSPVLADVDGNGANDLVMTTSNAQTGARLSVYDIGSGDLIAEAPAIGQGNRWRNLLAVAATGPNGEVEVIDVRTPHIGGIVQFFQYDGSGVLQQVAAIDTYSTHSIGSRNLDLGIVTDADGDGQLDVVAPTQDRRSIAMISRDDAADNGARETFRVDLGASITSNVSAQATADGQVSYAVGTADGRLVLWLA